MPPQTFHQRLARLYGETAAPALAQRLQTLLDRWAPVLGRPPLPPHGWFPTERDAVLITYADQIREAGAPPLRMLAGFAAAHLNGVVSGIHLLPFYPWSSDDGFSVKDFRQVDPAFGSWEEIATLGRSFDLMFDAVFNHLSAGSEWFERFLKGDPAFRDFFVTVEGNPDLSQVVRPRALPLLTRFEGSEGPLNVWTTFSADQVDLNFKNPEVLLAVLDVLLFYVAHGARFIRLDAIAFLWKEIGTPCLHLPQTHGVIQLMRAVLDAAAPQTLLITETNVPHRDNLSYFGDGTNEAQMVYNFALPPLVFHSVATGDAGKLTRWARSLALPSRQVSFFNFLASHDGIGVNPARGILAEAEIDALVRRTVEHGGLVSYKFNPDGSKSPYELNISYFDALSNPAAGEPLELQAARFLAAHAVMLALCGVPGLYVHSLLGSRGDPAGAAESGIPRRINRKKLALGELEEELAAPGSLRSLVFGGLKRLLQVRREHPAFHPCAPQEVLELDPRLFAVVRGDADSGGRVLCLQNLSGEPVALPAEIADGLSSSVHLSLGLAPWDGGRTLPPYQVVWGDYL